MAGIIGEIRPNSLGWKKGLLNAIFFWLFKIGWLFLSYLNWEGYLLSLNLKCYYREGLKRAIRGASLGKSRVQIFLRINRKVKNEIFFVVDGLTYALLLSLV